MLNIAIPGFGELKIKHIMFDFNGTLAVDGLLIKGIAEHLINLSKKFTLHVVTGDSSGTAQNELAEIDCQVKILPREDQAIAKSIYITELGSEHVAAIGNGRNDEKMLETARLGIAVLGEEGLAIQAINAADIVVPNIFCAVSLLYDNKRLLASLRS